MWDIFETVWFVLVIMPILMVQENYDRFKSHMEKHGYKIDWTDVTLFVLVLLLIVLLLLQYGYR